MLSLPLPGREHQKGKTVRFARDFFFFILCLLVFIFLRHGNIVCVHRIVPVRISGLRSCIHHLTITTKKERASKKIVIAI